MDKLTKCEIDIKLQHLEDLLHAQLAMLQVYYKHDVEFLNVFGLNVTKTIEGEVIRHYEVLQTLLKRCDIDIFKRNGSQYNLADTEIIRFKLDSTKHDFCSVLKNPISVYRYKLIFRED